MQIRKATGEEMLKLWRYPEETTASPTARFFYRNICSGNAVFWTVDNGKELLGELYVFLEIAEGSVFADGNTTAYLCAFRVKQEYRGLGLGHRLMDAALADLSSRGFQYATIGVNDGKNEALYRHMGFSTTVGKYYFDPCDRDEAMRPVSDEEGYLLLSKKL